MPEAIGLLVVFSGIHQTLDAETALRARGVATDLVPTPVAITVGCGFAILTPPSAEIPPWWYDLDSRRVLYRVVVKEGRKVYEEIGRCEGPCVPPTGDHEQEGPR
ncbi:MAG TPA: DUF3343 domain-containing protein [Spirochaetia bacterium]